MTIFDYIFYRVSKFYQKRDDDTFYFYGIGLVSILQLTYLVLALLLMSFISNDINNIIFEKGEGKNFLTSGIIFPVLIIYAINLIRYLKFKPYNSLDLKWREENENKKKRKKYQLIFLFIISIGMTISLSVYRRYYL